MREEKEEARKEEEETESPTAIVRLTGRDKELMGHVATARYLTLRQLKKVVFVRSLSGSKKGEGASSNEGPSDIVCKRRLNRLCDAKPAYLRRLQYRNREGAWVTVYATEPLGNAIARQVLGRAPVAAMQDVKPQFLEHTVRLNDLYVALAECCARQRLPPTRYPFSWISTESVGLPWQELSSRTRRLEERRLVPDAILEFPHEGLRVFLECEMGGHPLARKDENALGSALSKLNRYASFMVDGAQQSFYARKYPDGWHSDCRDNRQSRPRHFRSLGRLAGGRRKPRRAAAFYRALGLRPVMESPGFAPSSRFAVVRTYRTTSISRRTLGGGSTGALDRGKSGRFALFL